MDAEMNREREKRMSNASAEVENVPAFSSELPRDKKRVSSADVEVRFH